MFTLAQIEAAHSNIESGKDFPKFAKVIKEIGVFTFEAFVEDGSTIYKGKDGYEVSSTQQYKPLFILGITDSTKFSENIRNHQQGNADFFTFCKDCADSGIFKWIVDLKAKTCTYYDSEGNNILEEPIPG